MDSIYNLSSTKIASFSSSHIIAVGKIIQTLKQKNKHKIIIKKKLKWKTKNKNENERQDPKIEEKKDTKILHKNFN